MIARYPVTLASASPRRRDLLSRLLAEFAVVSPDIDEDSETLPLEDRATELALDKARAFHDGIGLYIGADTIVGLGDDALGKPDSVEDAKAMLRRLSGLTHRVITGIGIVWPGGESTFADVASVTFRLLGEAEIDAYVETGEPMDKAGAYAIQGGAGAFADHVEGDVDTVIGLPVARLANELVSLGLAVWDGVK